MLKRIVLLTLVCTNALGLSVSYAAQANQSVKAQDSQSAQALAGAGAQMRLPVTTPLDVAGSNEASPYSPANEAKPQASDLYIDVRSWVEYQVDGIEAHANIHYPDISSEIAQYAKSKDQTIYVYCAVGGRAEKARQSLVASGYTNVVNLGGIDTVKSSISQLDTTE